MKRNKYGAKRTKYNGVTYDSKFESEVAQHLDALLYSGQIEHWERQYTIELLPYDQYGNAIFEIYDKQGKPFEQIIKRHRVDFRLHMPDNTYILLEAKGVETKEYKRIFKWIKNLFLPQNLDHRYIVVKNKPGWHRCIK